MKNIRKIFQIIREVIEITPKSFYSATPRYCEVVSDVRGERISDTIDLLFQVSKLQNKFKTPPRPFKHNKVATSFYMIKNVITREIRTYLSIYNKEVELRDKSKKENQDFLLGIPEEARDFVLEQSRGVLRIESKYSSKRSLKDAFDLGSDINLYGILTSKLEVNYRLMSAIYIDAFNSLKPVTGITPKNFDRYNTLKQFDFDLEKILAVHQAMGNTREKSKILKPYRDLLKYHANTAYSPQFEMIKKIIEKLNN